MKAGPRKQIYFKPKDVKVAIVTCGGLCPGLNNVIREIVYSLNNNYGVSEIYGIKYGYRGKTKILFKHQGDILTTFKYYKNNNRNQINISNIFLGFYSYDWIPLTLEVVKNIHL